MTENQDLRSRLTIGRKRDGRREFDENAVQELVELCLRPGVSVARMAMDHDVNPNQLRRWISRYQQRQMAHVQADREHGLKVFDGVQIDMVKAPRSDSQVGDNVSAFVPVVSAPLALREATPQATCAALIALHVRLPNGVQFDLGEASPDEVSTIIQMLGRLPCSGSTKA
jgi:transposase